jgi:hypothetical protein
VDPDDPKTCGSGRSGSGSRTLAASNANGGDGENLATTEHDAWSIDKIKVSDPDPHGSALFELLDPDPHSNCGSGFSCSLGVLYGGQGISKLQFLIKKIEIKFPATNFFQFYVIKPWIRIRDPDPQLENAGSGSVSGNALNQCGSETLDKMANLSE